MEDADKWLGAILGLKLVNAVVAAVTSFAALKFFDGMPSKDRWMTFVGGWATAAWGAPPLREVLELKPGVEVGIVILLGLFGMALASEAIKLVRTTDWIGLVKSLRGGGGK
jgi:hypothetical protein